MVQRVCGRCLKAFEETDGKDYIEGHNSFICDGCKDYIVMTHLVVSDMSGSMIPGNPNVVENVGKEGLKANYFDCHEHRKDVKSELIRMEVTKCERCIKGNQHRALYKCTLNRYVRMCEYPHHVLFAEPDKYKKLWPIPKFAQDMVNYEIGERFSVRFDGMQELFRGLEYENTVEEMDPKDMTGVEKDLYKRFVASHVQHTGDTDHPVCYTRGGVLQVTVRCHKCNITEVLTDFEKREDDHRRTIAINNIMALAEQDKMNVTREQVAEFLKPLVISSDSLDWKNLERLYTRFRNELMGVKQDGENNTK